MNRVLMKMGGASLRSATGPDLRECISAYYNIKTAGLENSYQLPLPKYAVYCANTLPNQR